MFLEEYMLIVQNFEKYRKVQGMMHHDCKFIPKVITDKNFFLPLFFSLHVYICYI